VRHNPNQHGEQFLGEAVVDQPDIRATRILEDLQFIEQTVVVTERDDIPLDLLDRPFGTPG